MSPRTVSILAFLATAFAVNLWQGRRDRPAHVPFEIDPPPGFEAVDRGIAAVSTSDDTSVADARSQGGALYMRWGTDEEDKKYTEVCDVHQDDYPFRPSEAMREALFPGERIELQGRVATIVRSAVTTLGGHPVVTATLETKLGGDPNGEAADVVGKPVRIYRYVLPTDIGRAQVDCYALASEEAKYRPQYDDMIARARGVAIRPARLPWYVVAFLGAIAAAVAFAITRFLRRANEAGAAVEKPAVAKAAVANAKSREERDRQ